MVFMDNDWEDVFLNVGMELSGDLFNLIMKFEINDIKKFCNLMINVGVIVIIFFINGSCLEEKEERMFSFFRKLVKNDNIGINYDVYKFEKMIGDRNRVMVYLLKSDGFIRGNVEDVLDFYFK